jgi:L-iditol 2-dehydrogenase
MKAMFLTGIRRIEIRGVPDPVLVHPTDVLIRMGAVGVCGSDVHYYTTGRIGCQVVQYPFTIGHEGAGTVEAVGSAVTRVRPGDRIAIEPAVTCGHCDQCRAGRANTCRHNRFLGCPGQIPGCLSEFIVMPEQNCFPIRDTISHALATISEPLAIGVYAVKHAIPMAGATVGILGMGPIGMTVMLPALHAGAAAVYATDLLDTRLAIATKAGATWTGNPDRVDVVAEILKHEPLGLDVVFECCGKQEAMDQAVRLLKPGGKLMLIGIPEFDRVSFGIDDLRRKEICIQNVRRQEGCVQEALDLIESGAVNVQQLITHSFPLTRCQDAFDTVANYTDGVMKAMITMD